MAIISRTGCSLAGEPICRMRSHFAKYQPGILQAVELCLIMGIVSNLHDAFKNGLTDTCSELAITAP